ncbi:MAG: hypothetical protein I3273_04695, partial [Candidatus Moeniiplasma glomeromycotorum]|nr:hypothetical protein [Candidatus Moeniiplasma glomeromycotorum]
MKKIHEILEINPESWDLMSREEKINKINRDIIPNQLHNLVYREIFCDDIELPPLVNENINYKSCSLYYRDLIEITRRVFLPTDWGKLENLEKLQLFEKIIENSESLLEVLREILPEDKIDKVNFKLAKEHLDFLKYLRTELSELIGFGREYELQEEETKSSTENLTREEKLEREILKLKLDFLRLNGYAEKLNAKFFRAKDTWAEQISEVGKIMLEEREELQKEKLNLFQVYIKNLAEVDGKLINTKKKFEYFKKASSSLHQNQEQLQKLVLSDQISHLQNQKEFLIKKSLELVGKEKEAKKEINSLTGQNT